MQQDNPHSFKTVSMLVSLARSRLSFRIIYLIGPRRYSGLA